jgi:16S rRNA (cytosine967-C5)-methyltransferase
VLRATTRGRRLDLALGAAARGLEERDRRQLQELVSGTLRLRGRLDHLIARPLRKGIGSLDPDMLDVLRLAAYQLLRMDGVPRYAAVSQGVEQARTVGGEGVARLANAVLRKVADAGEDPSLFPAFDRDPVGHLVTWGSHPQWLVERWMQHLPPAEVRALVEANNTPPEVILQPWGITVQEGVRALEAAGIACMAVHEAGGGIRLPPGVDPARALQRVRGFIQDPAAALVPRYAYPDEGSVVADLCAAPGGKALALAARAGYVLAADPSGARLALVRENAARLGLGAERFGVVVARAEEPPVQAADLVLLDVPCSGTGTFRRHPDARWRVTLEGIASLARVQDRILDGGARAVRPGGVLVYSTCTLEPEENEERIRAFLERHPDFRMEPPALSEVQPHLDGQGFLRVFPHRDGFDGAFGARLKRMA